MPFVPVPIINKSGVMFPSNLSFNKRVDIISKQKLCQLFLILFFIIQTILPILNSIRVAGMFSFSNMVKLFGHHTKVVQNTIRYNKTF